MVEVILNVTDRELNGIGGDFTYYRALLNAQSDSLRFRTIPQTLRRSVWWQYGRLYGKLYHNDLLRRALPQAWRRRLRSRYLRGPVDLTPLSSYKKQVLIYSHIIYPDLPLEIPLARIWSSQGLVPDYYTYFGPHRLSDAAYTCRVLGKNVQAFHIWTQYGADNLRVFCPELAGKIRVIPPIVAVTPLPEMQRKRCDPMRLVFVGREPERKGLPDVLAAWRVLSRRYNHIELIVVTAPKACIKFQNNVPGAKFFSGLTNSQLHSLLETASILIVPTYADAYNLILVEAMAKGCAVISTNLGALREVAPDGEVGFLVRPGDVDQIIQRAAQLIDDPDLLRRMSESGRERFRLYHAPESVVPQMEKFFSEALG